MSKKMLMTLMVGALAVPALAIDLTVDPGAAWIGYMNVFEQPSGGGGYLWGSSWAPADLRAVYTGNELKLSPNTNCYNAADPYWVNPDGSGAKQMEANMYVENTGLVGQTVVFSGQTLANTLATGYASQAFIKVLDPNSGWATIASAYVPLVGGANFSVALEVPGTAGLIPQYGFMTTGLVANPATVDALGYALVAPIPEPASLMLLALGGLALARRR
jgi:hypothetical protein